MKRPDNYDDAKTLLIDRNLVAEENDIHFTALLMMYFNQSKVVERDYGIKLDRGLLVTGDTGVGKTKVMDLMKEKHGFFMQATPDVVNNYIEHGIEGLDNYTKFSYFKNTDGNYDITRPAVYCFDLLGSQFEQIPANYMGNLKNVMSEILFYRHRMGLLTHLITSKTIPEIKTKYGDELFDRMFETVSEINYPGKSKR